MSLTKGLATLCVQVLVDREWLDVDAPVSTYWPAFAAEGKAEVLVRHVSHTHRRCSRLSRPAQAAPAGRHRLGRLRGDRRRPRRGHALLDAGNESRLPRPDLRLAPQRARVPRHRPARRRLLPRGDRRPPRAGHQDRHATRRTTAGRARASVLVRGPAPRVRTSLRGAAGAHPRRRYPGRPGVRRERRRHVPRPCRHVLRRSRRAGRRDPCH